MLAFALYIFALFSFVTKRYIPGLFVCFFFFTSAFQFIPIEYFLAGLPIEKLSDYGLLLMYSLIIFKYYKNVKKPKDAVQKASNIFFLFVFFVAFYSITVLSYPFSDVVKVFRLYSVFMIWIIFSIVPYGVLERFFKYLMIITVIQATLYSLQFIIGYPLLMENDGSSDIQSYMLQSGYNRFYNIPPYIFIALGYYLFSQSKLSRLKKICFCAILIISILAPLHRTAILASIIAISILFLLKTSVRTWILYVGIIALLAIPVLSSSIVSERIEDAQHDISAINGFGAENFETGNTLLFRLGHFAERFDYVTEESGRFITGIGLVSDNSTVASRLNLPFRFGTPDVENGGIHKIDTGDVLWSLLILNIGVIGALLFIFLFYRLFNFFKRHIDDSNYASIGLLILLQLLITTISSTNLKDLAIVTIIYYLYILVFKEDEFKNLNDMDINEEYLIEMKNQE